MLVKSNALLPSSPSSSLLPKQNSASQPAPSQCSRCLLCQPGGQPALRPAVRGRPAPAHGQGTGTGGAALAAGRVPNSWQGKLTFPLGNPCFTYPFPFSPEGLTQTLVVLLDIFQLF